MSDQRAISYRLAERRRRAADHRWRCYDFGCEILGQGGWTQHGRDGGHWRRPVSLCAGQDSLEVIFAVTFAVNTNHMIEAYAELVGGPPLLVGQWSDDERPDGCRQSSGLELAGIQNALFEANQRLTPDRQHGGRYRRPPMEIFYDATFPQAVSLTTD